MFPREERYGLVDQIKRAAVSIPSNIAEGAARKSPKEFMQFLYIALGSAAELETQLVISKKLSFLAEEEILEKLERLKSKLLGLIRSLRDKSYVR
ncbi:MAG: four helix bundle protein [Nitrospiria bacterium]